jgi:hypothetical protein
VKIGMPRGSADLLWMQHHFGDAVTPVLYDNPEQIRLDLLARRIDMTFGAKINWTLELINKLEGKDCTLTKIRQKYLQTQVLTVEDHCIDKTS